MTSSFTIQNTTLRVPPDLAPSVTSSRVSACSAAPVAARSWGFKGGAASLGPAPRQRRRSPRKRLLATVAAAPFVSTARALVALPMSLPEFAPCGLGLDRRPPRPYISFRVTTLGVAACHGHSSRTEPRLMDIGRHLHDGPRPCRRGGGVVEHTPRAVAGGQPGAAAARTLPVRCASVGRRRVNRHSRRLHVGQ